MRSYKWYALSLCSVYDYGTISIWTIGCYVTEVKRNVMYAKISWKKCLLFFAPSSLLKMFVWISLHFT